MLPLAADTNSKHDQCEPGDLERRDRFMEKKTASHHDQDKAQAHEGIGVTNVELRHRRHPSERGKKRGGETAEDPGIRKQSQQKYNLSHGLRRQLARLRDLPLEHQLAIDREHDREANIDESDELRSHYFSRHFQI